MSLFLFLASYTWVFYNNLYVKNISKWKYIFIGFLFAFSYFFRPTFGIFYVIYSLPLIVTFLPKKHWVNLGILFLSIIILITTNVILSNVLYSNYDHDRFQEYSVERSNAKDTGYGYVGEEDLDEALVSAGWSNNDYDAYIRWFFVDETIFNAKSFSNFTKYGSTILQVNKMGRILKYHSLKLIQFSLLVLLLMLVSKNNNKPIDFFKSKTLNGMYFLLVPLYFVCGVLVLSTIRFVIRVYFTLYMLIMISSIMSLSVFNYKISFIERLLRIPVQFSKKYKRIIVVILVAIVVIFSTIVSLKEMFNLKNKNNLQFVEYIKGEMIESTEVFNSQIDYLDNYCDGNYIILPLEVHYYVHLTTPAYPFVEYKYFRKSTWVPLGWVSQSEYFYQVLENAGYSSGTDLLKSIATGDENVFICSIENGGNYDVVQSDLKFFYTYLEEHYSELLKNSRVEYKKIYSQNMDEDLTIHYFQLLPTT